MSNPDWIIGIVKLIFAVLAVVAILWGVLFPLLRMLRAKPDLEIMTRDFSALEDEEGSELQIPSGKERPGRSELIDLARRDPRRTAIIIQRWIRQRR